ncbi:MAG: YfhO family protein [Anaerolineae bacterium]
MAEGRLPPLPRLLRQWGPPLLLAALPTLWLAKLAFGGQVLYWGIPLQQFYPWRSLVVEAWRAGEVPLWNPWLGGGAPLLANHQSAALYPLTVLFFLFPVEHALGASALLHLSLAAVGMYGYARHLGRTRPASTLSALAFAFGGYIVARLHFPTMVCAMAWVPLALWAGDRLALRPSAWRAAALGCVLALQFLAGHVQLWYYTLWLVGAYVLWRAAARRQAGRAWPALGKAFGALAGAVVLAVLLSAAQFLPTAELARESQRQGGAEYEFAMTYSFWPWRLLTLVAPDFFGNPGHGDYWGYATYWEDAAYAGLLPLFLALYAGWRWARARRDPPQARPQALETAPFFLALALLSLLLALGKNLPLYPWAFRWVPGFGLFQAPSRLLCWYAVAVAVLAGLGWDLLGPSPRLQRAARFLCVGALGILAAALVARVALPQVRGTFSRALFATGGLGLGAGLLLVQRAGLPEAKRAARAWWSAAALAFAAVDLWIFSLPLIPTTDPRLYHLPTETGQWLREDPDLFRIYTFAQTEYNLRYRTYLPFHTFGPAEVDFLMGLRETLLPNLNVMEEIAHAGNFDPLLVGRYARFLARANEAPLEEGLRLLGLLNVRYILEPGPLGDLEPVQETAHVRIYRNPYALPRAWVAHRARVVLDSEALLSALSDPAFDPRQEVLLEEPSPLPGGTEASPLEEVPPSLHVGPSSSTIDVALAEPGYLCLSQTFYPGWEARVDGEPAPVVRGDALLTVVPLPAGVHRVELRYRPRSFWVGAALSGGAWLGLGGALGLRRRRGGKAAQSPVQTGRDLKKG